MKKLCIVLIITVVFGFQSIAEAKRGSAEMVNLESQDLTYIPADGGWIWQFRDTDQVTGDLEGTLDSFCNLFIPTTPDITKYAWNCLSVFSGTLKGEPIKAVLNLWQADSELDVRKVEIMQGTGGLTGEGKYTGTRGEIRYLEFNYWFCDRESSKACEARIGY